MAVLATFTNVSALSLAGRASGCIAHGLPTQPDWAFYQPTSSIGALVTLVTRESAGLWWHNTGGSATPGESVSKFEHSLVR